VTGGIVPRPRQRLARPTPSFPCRFDPARYDPTYLQLGLLEAAVQAATVQRLWARWKAKVTVIDSGDGRLRGRAAQLLAWAGGDPAALKGHRTTMERGVGDLAVTFPHLGGRAGWFELKRPARYSRSKTGRMVIAARAGEPTDEQVAFLLAQQRAGAIVGVLWRDLDLEELVRAAERSAA
jgi:hypothetical protein